MQEFKKPEFKGKTVFITGSSRGIGRAIAEELAGQGASIILHGRGVGRLNDAVDLMKVKGADVIGHNADLENVAEVRQLCAQIFSNGAEIDGVVLNAAAASTTVTEELTEAEFDRLIDINVKANFIIAQQALLHMKKRGKGHIVFIGSISGLRGRPQGGAAYAASKAAIVGLSRTIANEYGQFGITCNVVAPGIVATDMALENLSPELIRRVSERTPMKRIASPQDVAKAVMFLLSEQARFITGEVLNVDGGFSNV